MVFTDLRLGEIVRFGIFDTAVKYPHGYKTPPRKTKACELEYYISCDGEAYIDSEKFTLSTGSVLFGKAGQMRHSLTHFKCYYLHIDMTDCEFGEVLKNAPDYYRIIDEEVYGGIFESLVLHLLSYGYNKDSNFVKAKLLELYYHLEKDAGKNRNYQSVYPGGDSDFVPEAIRYIDKNYGEKLTLSSVASAVGYSPNYFWHVFTSVMGTTPQKYILKVRIKIAKKELANTDKSISDIALDCGFSSQQHFNLMFKRETMMTPREYRKLNISRYTKE